MRRKRSRSGAAWFLLAAHLVINCGLAANLVLCSSPNGHVAIESAFAGDCCDDHALPGEPTVGRRTDGDCGCVDTPLVQASDRGTTVEPRELTPAADATPLGLATHPLQGLTAMRALTARHLGPPNATRALRSVVLRV